MKYSFCPGVDDDAVYRISKKCFGKFPAFSVCGSGLLQEGGAGRILREKTGKKAFTENQFV